MNLKPCSRGDYEEFAPEDDGFTRTFISKTTMLGRWGDVVGAWDDGGFLMGASLMTVGKRNPHVANLQLLHTFPEYRGAGVGSLLLRESLRSALFLGASYFRVSSEKKAIPFYERNGFVMLGEQKSGTQLSMGFFQEEEGETSLVFDPKEDIIRKAIERKGKGGCVKLWNVPGERRLLIGGLGQ